MADTSRKTLRLPARPAGESVPVNPKRKPLRSGAPKSRAPRPVEAAAPVAEKKNDWRKKSAETHRDSGAPRRERRFDETPNRGERSERDGWRTGAPRREGEGGRPAYDKPRREGEGGRPAYDKPRREGEGGRPAYDKPRREGEGGRPAYDKPRREGEGGRPAYDKPRREGEGGRPAYDKPRREGEGGRPAYDKPRREGEGGRPARPAPASPRPFRESAPRHGGAMRGERDFAPPERKLPPPRLAPLDAGVRVAKLMAERGLCSRREADQYIERGWVFVDGQRISELGTRVSPEAKITLDKQAQATQGRQMTVLLHKPVGFVSGQPEPGFRPAVSLVLPENQFCTPDTPLFTPGCLKGLAPAGRLDIDSTGLLVLTQDGRIARQLIGEDSDVEKEYLVRVAGTLDDNGLALLNHGLHLDGQALRPAVVEWLNEDQLRFILKEGRKRQIRRMCELVGLRVVGLKRVRIGRVRLGDLPPGQWRYLGEDEIF